MITDDAPSGPLPGFILRKKWAREGHNRCDRTAYRWQVAGKIVVRYFGKDPFVDVPATAARMRGEDKPKRRRGTFDR